MKTYKTWEVIKMLNENKNMQFTRPQWIGTKITYIKTKEKEGIGFTEEGNFWDRVENQKTRFEIGTYMLYDDWILVQQPVDFMTAVKSGKWIRVEHELLRTYTVYKDYSDIKYLLDLLVDIFDEKEIRKVLTEGKFYIEEE